MRENNQTEITTIGLSIALIISAGIVVYIAKGLIPIPGLKYILLAPFMSLVFYVTQLKIKQQHTQLKMGTAFALLMAIINIMMTISIMMATLLAHFSTFWIGDESRRIYWSSALFSAYSSFSALFVSKHLIGGVFSTIPLSWIIGNALISLLFGCLANQLASQIYNRIETP